MTGIHLGVVGKREEHVADRPQQRIQVPARQVGSAYRSCEQRIADEQGPAVRGSLSVPVAVDRQTYAAGTMAGRVVHARSRICRTRSSGRRRRSDRPSAAARRADRTSVPAARRLRTESCRPRCSQTGTPSTRFAAATPVTWSRWAWVRRMCFACSLRRVTTSRRSSTSSPGSTTTASSVSSHPRTNPFL